MQSEVVDQSQEQIERVAAICLLIASKLEEIYPPRLKEDILRAVSDSNTED